MSGGSQAEVGDKARRRAEASTWRMRLAEDPMVDRSEDFLSWLAEPGAVDAFDAVDRAWDVFDQAGADHRLIAARRDALVRARKARGRSGRFNAAWMQMAAGIALAVTLAAGVGLWLPTRATVYETGRGERQVVMLQDGSRLSLDSATRVSVRMTPGKRDLVLDRGQARFDVAHDTRRPFTVRAGEEVVTAVGTAFNVERLGPRVVVTLIEGKVRVHRDDAPRASADTLTMNAGQRLIAAPTRPARVEKVAVDAVTAWEGGKLVFQDETLVDAVARVNRYAGRPIEVDPSLASLRISGAFNTGDTAAFVDAVVAYFPVTAAVGGDEQIVLRPRG